jgi:hypothetical protein
MQLGHMPLAIGDGQSVALKTLTLGNGKHGGGVQPAAQQEYCFFHGCDGHGVGLEGAVQHAQVAIQPGQRVIGGAHETASQLNFQANEPKTLGIPNYPVHRFWCCAAANSHALS